ncbi:MAG: glycine betaine ABC transporter substrate-binding protein [Hymenobacter sp.]
MLAPALVYEAARDGHVDVIDGYSTDGRIRAYGLRVLARRPPRPTPLLCRARAAARRCCAPTPSWARCSTSSAASSPTRP